jgi:ATP-dependent protease HslVU (ClpYQ) peptidase subunit
VTIIIALAHKEGVTIGSDSLWVAGQDMLKQDQMKWTMRDDGLSMGLSGNPFLAEEMGKLSVGFWDPIEFCDMLRGYFRTEDRWPPEIGKEGNLPTWDLNLILTDGLDVWEVGASLYPLTHERGVPVAMGSGYQYALGAMYVDYLYQKSCGHGVGMARAHSIVTHGVEAAIHHDTKCGGEPWVETVTKKAPA